MARRQGNSRSQLTAALFPSLLLVLLVAVPSAFADKPTVLTSINNVVLTTPYDTTVCGVTRTFQAVIDVRHYSLKLLSDGTYVGEATWRMNLYAPDGTLVYSYQNVGSGPAGDRIFVSQFNTITKCADGSTSTLHFGFTIVRGTLRAVR